MQIRRRQGGGPSQERRNRAGKGRQSRRRSIEKFHQWILIESRIKPIPLLSSQTSLPMITVLLEFHHLMSYYRWSIFEFPGSSNKASAARAWVRDRGIRYLDYLHGEREYFWRCVVECPERARLCPGQVSEVPRFHYHFFSIPLTTVSYFYGFLLLLGYYIVKRWW